MINISSDFCKFINATLFTLNVISGMFSFALRVIQKKIPRIHVSFYIIFATDEWSELWLEYVIIP